MMSPSESPPDQGRVFPLLREEFGRRSLTPRRAAGVISIATVILTVAGGVAIWLVDSDSFSSLGEGLWWAVQTLTTVGYGDVVPDDTPGRLIGTLVMLVGIAFLTVITAAVTATLIDQMRHASSSVTRARRRRCGPGEQPPGDQRPPRGHRGPVGETGSRLATDELSRPGREARRPHRVDRPDRRRRPPRPRRARDPRRSGPWPIRAVPPGSGPPLRTEHRPRW